jgi:Flp pilus assembly protein TadG
MKANRFHKSRPTPGSRRYAQGQSTILLALMLVVLVSFVGLSVDVGHVYAEQRHVQQAANAAALAGMAAWDRDLKNGAVTQNILRALAANGIDYTTGSNFTYTASYVLEDGTTRLLRDLSASASPPDNVERVAVSIRQEVDTYFARVVGRRSLPAIATAYGCLGGYNLGVYPIGLNVEIRREEGLQKYLGPWIGGSDRGTTEIPYNSSTQATWREWHTAADSPSGQAEYVKIPFHNKFDAMNGVHFPWLVWKSGTNHSNDTLNASLSYPGNLASSTFTEAAPPAGSSNGPRNNELEPGDWLDVNPGTRSANETVLQEHVTIGDIMLLPMYHDAKPNGNGKSGNYVVQVVKMGMFKLVDADQTGGDQFMAFEYLGTSGGSVGQCGAHPRTDDATLSGNVVFDQLTRSVDGGSRSSDIVMLLSVSENMLQLMDPGSSSVLRKDDVRSSLEDFAEDLAEDEDIGEDHNLKVVTYGNPSGVGLYTTWDQPWLSGSEAITTNIDSALSDIDKALATVVAGNQRPGARALANAGTYLSSSPGGAGNKKVIIMVVDGVMNVCSTPVGGVCVADGPAPGTTSTQWTSAAAQLTGNWPLWQAQEEADRLHRPTSVGGLGAQIFVIALTRSNEATTGWFDTRGLRDIASGPGYYYDVATASELDQALESIERVIKNGPSADSAHSTIAYCNPTSQLLAAPSVRITLVDDNGHAAKEVTTDAAGNFVFTGVRPGDYTFKLESTIGGPPTIFGRTYSRVFDYNDRSRTGSAANNAIGITIDKGAVVSRKLLLRGALDNHSLTTHVDAGESGCSP